MIVYANSGTTLLSGSEENDLVSSCNRVLEKLFGAFKLF